MRATNNRASAVAAPVQNVGEFIFAALGFKTQAHPARLKIFTTNSGNSTLPDIAPAPAPRLRCRHRLCFAETHMSPVQSMMTWIQQCKPSSCRTFSRVATTIFSNSFVQPCSGPDDFDQLHLVELMHSDHSACAQTGRARFARESMAYKRNRKSATASRPEFPRDEYLPPEFRPWESDKVCPACRHRRLPPRRNIGL